MASGQLCIRVKLHCNCPSTNPDLVMPAGDLLATDNPSPLKG